MSLDKSLVMEYNWISSVVIGHKFIYVMLPETVFILEVDDSLLFLVQFPTVHKNKLESPVQVPGCLLTSSDKY